MKALRLAAVLTVAVLSLGVVHGSALAANNGNGTDHFGPFASTTTDGGSCGNLWATDTVNRYFDVHNNQDGTFTVKEWFKDGTFVTMGSASPGACETSSHHGTLLQPGVSGTFQGFLTYVVVGGTYNPSGCSTAPDACSTTAGFIDTVLPGNTGYDCPSDNSTCFNFEYSSSDPTLAYHHWQDAGSGTDERFVGDIANS